MWLLHDLLPRRGALMVWPENVQEAGASRVTPRSLEVVLVIPRKFSSFVLFDPAQIIGHAVSMLRSTPRSTQLAEESVLTEQ